MVLLSLFHVRHTPITEMYVSLSQQAQVLIASAKVLFSWREACIGLVIGGGAPPVPNTKLSITCSVFGLQSPDFAWKFIWTV